MKNKYIQQCIELTEKMMIEYYQGDASCIIEHLHEQCLWIGFYAEEFYHGKETVSRMLREKEKNIAKIHLTAKEFQSVAQDRHGCIIVGRYHTVTDMISGELYRDTQRVTFVWKETEGKLIIHHMHVSNPVRKDTNDEEFPDRIGAYTYDYLNMLIRKEIEKKGTLSVKDQGNRYHIMQISDIYYCEAFNTNTIIHTVNGDIFARIMLKSVQEKIMALDDEMFIRVHKSFLVNKFYVNSIKRYELELASQYTIPVSKEKYIDVKDHLHI